MNVADAYHYTGCSISRHPVKKATYSNLYRDSKRIARFSPSDTEVLKVKIESALN